jgi:hypothetical protein
MSQKPKTIKNEDSVSDFIAAIEDSQKRADSQAILDLMERLTGCKGEMWGPSIVGFGTYTYKYASGREGDWMLTGFSPRKQALTLYIMSGFKRYDDLLQKLGKHKTGKSCLYVKRLADLDMDVLEELISESVIWMKSHNHRHA